MNIRRRLGAGFGIVLLLTTVLGVTVLLKMADVKRKFTFVVEHDAPVMANARQLSKLVVDMEAGQKGFCITGKEEFLEPYEEGLREFERLVVREKAMIAGNPGQVRRIERIESLVDQWRRRAAGPEIAMARKVATHEIDARHLQSVLRRGIGKKLRSRA